MEVEFANIVRSFPLPRAIASQPARDLRRNTGEKKQNEQSTNTAGQPWLDHLIFFLWAKFRLHFCSTQTHLISHGKERI